MKKNKVYIFTMDTCVHCSHLKNILDENGINFTEIEITVNNELWKQVVEQTNSNVVPTVYLKKSENEGHIYVPGKDYQTEDEILNILKSSIE